MHKIFEDDLQHIYTYTESIFEELRDENIFLTGGTGFFGIWFLESFIYLNEKLNLNAEITVLSRDPEKFLKKYQHIASNDKVSFLKGDVRNFEFIDKKFSYIIHAATTAAKETFNEIDALDSFDIIANGTKRVFDFALVCKAKKVLLTSSGSIYGQSKKYELFSEDSRHGFNPIDLKQASSEAKRVSELYASYYSQKYNIEIKIARCFTFVGPYLQMDIHYAIGNFIKSAAENKIIVIDGDGSPIRSYMYASDLMIWLWTILFNAKAYDTYNVGSSKSISIYELAKLVASCFDEEIEIVVKKDRDEKLFSSYLPSTKKALNNLGLKEHIELKDAIYKTIRSLNCQ